MRWFVQFLAAIQIFLAKVHQRCAPVHRLAEIVREFDVLHWPQKEGRPSRQSPQQGCIEDKKCGVRVRLRHIFLDCALPELVVHPLQPTCVQLRHLSQMWGQ